MHLKSTAKGASVQMCLDENWTLVFGFQSGLVQM